MNDYTTFKTKVIALIKTSGENLSARFEHDEDKGLFIARISDGSKILWNSTAHKATVRFGSGHQAQFVL